MPDIKLYYSAIFGPFPSYVQKGLEKMRDLGAEYICNSHGPVLTKDGLLGHVMEMYDQWSQPEPQGAPNIPVFYCTAYGNTKQLAEKIQEGILSVLPQANVELYDIIEHDLGELHGKLNKSSAFAVGTPTLNKDAVAPVWMLLAGVDAINCAKKPCLVFGSYGWSGEGVPNVKQRLESLKMKVFGDGYRVTFVPNNEDLEHAKQLGADFAATL